MLALAPRAAKAVQVWAAGAAEKIRPGAPPRDAAEASLGAARNELEAFQVVVTGPATHVVAQASPLVSRKGTVEDVKLYRVDLIDARNPSAVDGGTGRWPDALVPDVDDVVGEQRNAFPFDVPAGESRAIWVEVHVPAGAKPGAYQGAVRIGTAEGDAAIRVSLEVWDFALPSTSSLRTHFGLSYGVLGAGHGLRGDADASLRARYAQLALDHRVSLGGIADDGSQGDFDHFDRFYGPLVTGTAPTRLAGARLTSVKYVGDSGSVDEYLKALSDAGGAAEAREIARKLFPNAYSTDARTEDLMAARQAIAYSILMHTGKDLPGTGGGCGSGGPGGGALLLLPALAAMALGRALRRRQEA